uniref:Elongation factor Tu, chloroplastic n=1 Tax=Dunaliella tertiolecta TaxID=3047 RepID=A0A7S3RAJ0_DUNTE|mmetsp:Transcript_1675/g.4164  ORF Transcript_1675/g.4164 Transcript_1675/m.4164 type:complete len:692 (-) Transcript_1675:442-2517(-)|eukprot:CAMPEP_0202350678 /NCGR_PEP_ID=MMETSP1126-20121109/7651_1 /ASSEMBLY_ACC=CAM_ASM_000457 /TAXON_ID=3047 /ORGANISM="Dunaliella tertiolecta, Strain CCMP1320" /LENGTH=691 /DNA_ID=CAMNT_0048942691 /DNA_START=76 /DNA_END=2151 /DNA_ORIENTATION=-
MNVQQLNRGLKGARAGQQGVPAAVHAPAALPVRSSGVPAGPAYASTPLAAAPQRLSTSKVSQQRVAPIICNAAAAEAPPAPAGDGVGERQDLRNVAIIAHVDHGKTTLVDKLLLQSKVFRDNQATSDRMMDNNDLERERGITILAKNTAIRYKDVKINIIDTPGHADFGGEVERVLNMCDGVLLLVDSVEGPMPQTRFVLRKSLALNKKVVVVVNKIDREAARPDWVIDRTFELFMDLGASDEQCDFPVVYASGFSGISGLSLDNMAPDMDPLFQTIVKEIQPPVVKQDAPLQMLVASVEYDNFLGRIAVGRVMNGTIKKGQQVAVCSVVEGEGAKTRMSKVVELYAYDQFNKVSMEEVPSGDIVAVSGIQDVKIGETICAKEAPVALDTIKVEEPTVSMVFMINTSPFAGKEGKYVTTRNLKDRLDKELERNLALRVEAGESADSFVVSGRGMMHLGILIENMRREGFEFEIGPPKVILQDGPDGKKYEPFEEAYVEVPEQYVGAVVELFAQRKGEMLDMSPPSEGGTTTLKFRIATRGLVGLRNNLLTATRGLGQLNTLFLEYGPQAGTILMREQGSIVAHETGQVTAYALESAQDKGTMFIRPGDQVYEGQCVGQHVKAGDMKINVCKTKALTNMRAAGSDKKAGLNEPRNLSLDDALEYINEDEMVEVTPKNVRIRKDPAYSKKGRK